LNTSGILKPLLRSKLDLIASKGGFDFDNFKLMTHVRHGEFLIISIRSGGGRVK
jgi:hypothetical protein